MGATSVYVEIEGMSMRDAFKDAQQRAEDMYGSDYYNGQINNGALVGDRTSAYNSLSTKKRKSDYIDEKMDNADKGDVYGICISAPKESTRKQKSKVERFPQKGARKWVTKYVVEDYHNDKEVGKWEDQTTAIKEARAYTERTGKRCSIEITKVLLGGQVRVANITPIEGNKKKGRYIFFGCVPC